MKLYYWLKDWQLPGQQHKGATKVEIPTDAAGLCHWLNARNVPISRPLDEPPAASEPEPPAPQPKAAQPLPTSFEATAIEDFLLNRATVAQCERVFAVLGTRFAEARPCIKGHA